MIGAIRVEMQALESSVRFNEAEYKALLQGPIVQDLVRRAIRVEAAAKTNATRRPGPNVITGRLRSSITWRIGNDSQGPYVDIGTNVEYAPYVEFGHRNTPHAYPKRGGGVGWVGSRPTRPYPFLLPALEAARST